MFKKSERLSRAQFDTFFRSGKRIQTEKLTLIYSPYPTRHIAVVVGKKVAKKAHERNMIRRRLYGVMYRMLQTSDTRGVFIIF